MGSLNLNIIVIQDVVGSSSVRYVKSQDWQKGPYGHRILRLTSRRRHGATEIRFLPSHTTKGHGSREFRVRYHFDA